MMTDQWFDEYTYEVVVDKQYLSKKLLKYLDMKPGSLTMGSYGSSSTLI